MYSSSVQIKTVEFKTLMIVLVMQINILSISFFFLLGATKENATEHCINNGNPGSPLVAVVIPRRRGH